MAEIQNYKNHVRYYPLHHFIVSPILIIHFAYSLVRFWQEPNFDRGEALLFSIGLVLLGLVVRFSSLKVQNRVIRLEEQLRYQKLLPAETAARAAALPLGKIFALRFASDEELPGLVARALRGEFQKPDEIKRAIQNWRADNLRV